MQLRQVPVQRRDPIPVRRRRFGAPVAVLIPVALLAGCVSSDETVDESKAATPATTVAGLETTTTEPRKTPSTSDLGQLTQDSGDFETGEITSEALANNLIGDPATREYEVYLPPGYHTSESRYPVVYALHGYTLDCESMTPMGSELSRLIASGEAREMILVFVDGQNSFDGSLYLSSPTIGDYETYVVRELVAHIDASYRTLADRDHRGITGCSMGGEAALRLALKHPEVFSATAPMSAVFDYENDPLWDQATANFRSVPEDFTEVARLHWATRWFFAAAAALASNPDKPPLYLDSPFEIVDGQARIVSEVHEKVGSGQPMNYIDPYLSQPLRLRGLLICQGVQDQIVPVEGARAFDQLLTSSDVEHEYRETLGGHCPFECHAPVLQFMSDQLTTP